MCNYLFYYKDFCIEVPVPPKGTEILSCSMSGEPAKPIEEPDDWTPFWEKEEEQKTTRKQIEEESDQPGLNLYSK